MADRSEIDTGTGELLAQICDRVAILTLNRPEARNALSDQLTPALRRMIKRFSDDAEVGTILIAGAGTAFCAGGDVKGMGQGSTKAELTFEQRVNDLRIKQRTLTGALVAVRKPTIAAIHTTAFSASSRNFDLNGEARIARAKQNNPIIPPAWAIPTGITLG